MATYEWRTYADSACAILLDYDAGTLKVTAVRCVNTSGRKIRLTILDGVTVVHTTTLDQGTTQITIPNGKTVTLDQALGLISPYGVRDEFGVP